MKQRKCRLKDACWGYSAGICEDCQTSEKIEKYVREKKKLLAENAELRARLEKAIEVPFVVLDKTTGKEADLGEIALHEEWAKSLAYCDMDGFAITQNRALLLLDECGKFEYCPSDRFEIVAEARLKEIKEKMERKYGD